MKVAPVLVLLLTLIEPIEVSVPHLALTHIGIVTLVLIEVEVLVLALVLIEVEVLALISKLRILVLEHSQCSY